MKTMEDFYTLALELDADWKNSRPKINFRNNCAISADEPGREEVRVAKLSDAERQKLMEENKCFRCKKVGHQARNCKSRPAPPTRAARQMDVVEAIANEDVKDAATRVHAIYKNASEEEKAAIQDRLLSSNF